MVPTSKQCNKCREVKPLGAFYRRSASLDGRQAHCKPCSNRTADEYAAAHPEFTRAKTARRRARKLGATPELFTSAELYALWAEADAWACVFCGAPWAHQEHFVPLARGGDHALGNIWPACADCNLTKSDRDPWEYLRSRGVPGV